MGIVYNVKKTVKKAVAKMTGRYYDMSTAEGRENTVMQDYEYAKTARNPQQIKWVNFDKYYHGQHIVSLEIAQVCKDLNIPFTPAIIPDPFIHVESQIIPNIPDFQFAGRDDDMDSIKAKEREKVVKYVIENNKLEQLNTANERRLNKFGNAFYKVAYNHDKQCGDKQGDIELGNPDPANIFPDPAALNIQGCEFIILVYPIHKRKAQRDYEKALKDLKISIEDISSGNNVSDTQIYNESNKDVDNETVQIKEYWFRQPEDGKGSYEAESNGIKSTINFEWESGDIACITLINETEVQYIPKYWIKTGKQNKSFPFIKYCKVPIENAFWDKSDLEAIIPLVDQCDRELGTIILNDAMMGNDMVIVEEDALIDGGELVNTPGAINIVGIGKLNSIKRLGGLGNPGNRIAVIEFLRHIVMQVVGNFEINMGDAPPPNITTLGGLIELKQQGNMQQAKKKVDRRLGYEDLYALIDWTALEFFDDNRLIYIGATKENEQPQQPFSFNSDNHVTSKNGQPYFPKIDVMVQTGDDIIQHSKSLAIRATEQLMNSKISAENYKIAESMLDMFDIPNKDVIKKTWDLQFNPQMQPQQNNTASIVPKPINPDDILKGLNPEELAHLQQNPQLLDEMMGG